MRAIVLAAVLSLGGFFASDAFAQFGPSGPDGYASSNFAPSLNVRFEAPVGHRQPSVTDIAQATATKGDRSSSESQADEEVRRAEETLRKKLIICRC